MKKIYKLIAIIIVMFSFLTVSAQQREKCGTQEWLETQFRAHPELRAQYDQREQALGAAITAKMARRAAGQEPAFAPPVTIPIVFHVVLTAAQHAVITDAMIMSQLNVLNVDYGGRNADSANVPAAFQAVRGHATFSFCLAQRTPAGLATTGIERIISNTKSSSSSTNDPIKSTAAGGADAWDPSKYVNIWLTTFTNTQLLGYATFPIGSPEGINNPTQQGVVVLAQSIPGGTAAPYNKGRTLTHELGHFFWLRHITGDVACGNDFPNTPGIDDTPQQSDLTGGCPGTAPVVNSSASGCAASPNPPGRMFQNYMDYTDDGCMTMFTNGQNLRSEMAINMYRASLLTSDGCLPPSGFTFTTPATTNVGCAGPASASTTLSTTSAGGYVVPVVLTATSGVP
ncbi:MAG: C-terminal target protein, partial [Ferruginibacter sp.]|nr:C-terminal target protein [Ferruginibacter sp.]